jgi:hypothetical protein
MFNARLAVGDELVPAPVLNVVSDASATDRNLVSEGAVITRSGLDGLPDRVRELWSNPEVPAGLVAHVVREAFDSDLFLGVSPETWSPLGVVDQDSVARLRNDYADGGVSATGSTDAGSPIVDLVDDNGGVYRLSYGRDAFVLVVPAEAEVVEIDNLDDDGAELNLDGGETDELVVWRLYTGSNSWVRDAVTAVANGVHRLRVRERAGGGIGILVGRAVKVAAKRSGNTQRDPFFRVRLAWHGRFHRDVATACPVFDPAAPVMDRAVVVVHGTMATGFNLASAVRSDPPRGIEIRRFEHNTWLPIEKNAQELAALVKEYVRHEVLFVAHSRGGLVVRNAMEILTADSSCLTMSAVTLGTPYLGTPLIDAVKAAYLGVQTLMGGLRWAGGPVVDVVTRLAGLVIKRDPPQGITDMSPGPGYLSGFKLRPPESIHTFAGAVPECGANGHGFLRGLSSVLLADPHDLVVPTASALGGRKEEDGKQVISDHFTYLKNEAVLDAIGAAIHRQEKVAERRKAAARHDTVATKQNRLKILAWKRKKPLS